MNHIWDSDIEETIVRPIGKKAIDIYAEEVISEDTELRVLIDGYQIVMMRNRVIEEDIHDIIFPEAKDANYQINVEVGIPSGEFCKKCNRIHNILWYVGIYYSFEDGVWIEDKENERKQKVT